MIAVFLSFNARKPPAYSYTLWLLILTVPAEEQYLPTCGGFVIVAHTKHKKMMMMMLMMIMVMIMMMIMMVMMIMMSIMIFMIMMQ